MIPLSVAAPDSQSILMNVRSASAKKSVAKIFGPIASLKPILFGANFSFTVDAQKECEGLIELDTHLVFSSPGNAGQANAIYGHVHAADGVSCSFSTARATDIMTDVIATFINVSDASIIFLDKNDHQSVTINLGSDLGAGVTETKGYARDIKVEWGGSNVALNILEALFIADKADERVDTTTSALTTTTSTSTLPLTTTNSSRRSSMHELIQVVILLPLMSLLRLVYVL